MIILQVVYQKEIQKNAIIHKCHPIFYTTRDYMGAPKESKGMGGVLNCVKLISTPSKSLLFPSSSIASGATFHAPRFLLSLPLF